ncbi:SH3 domain-containing protein [Brucellaceae bacterium C25G]
MRKCTSVWVIAAVLILSLNAPSYAQTEEKMTTPVGKSGLPLPRFVSLKPARANIRVGPGRDYAVSWLFLKSGLPVEIIQEYDNWRRIRDADGTEGWIYQSLLSGKRTAVTAPWEKSGRLLELRSSPQPTANVVAQIEGGVIANVRECNGEWCRLEVNKVRGWLPQRELWGAYPGEVFD